MLIGLFVHGGMEMSSRFYLKYASKFTYYCIVIAEFILPFLISILSLWCMLRLPKEDGGDRLYAGAEYFFILSA